MTPLTMTDGWAVVREMRRRRRRNRVAELEWFEALYRVYLTGLAVLFSVLFLAGLVDDSPFTAAQLDSLATNGPRVVGLVAAAMVFLGGRNGANGGPLGIEDADVRHVLLAPLPLGAVLRKPALQRLRSDTSTGMLVGAVTGLLVSRRTDDPPMQWVLACAVAGGCILVLRPAAALVAHGSRAPRWLVSSIVSVLALWQGGVTIGGGSWAGPFDALGRLALWPITVNPLDAAAPVVIGIVAVVGTALTARMSVEALARRSALVAQLRFAVTLQDIRTVMLLRRQLGQEHTRSRPWVRVRGRRLGPAAVRSIRSIARFPARRLVRIAITTVIASCALTWSLEGNTPLVVVAGALLFLAALDVVEPLSQEVDQPWRTDLLPVERGSLFVRLLLGPAVVGCVLGVIGLATAMVLRPEPSTLGVGAMIAVSAVSAALAGATISTVRGAPDPVSESNSALYMPPEVSGLTTVVRTVWPPAVSVAGCLPVAFVIAAERAGRDPLPMVARSVLGVCLGVALVLGWVRKRDDIRRWWTQMQKDARR